VPNAEPGSVAQLTAGSSTVSSIAAGTLMKQTMVPANAPLKRPSR
jgi:hypothetical protein